MKYHPDYLCPHLILSDNIFSLPLLFLFVENTKTQTMVEPCTCGEAMGASAAMAADQQLALLIPPDLFSDIDGKLKCSVVERSTYLLRYICYFMFILLTQTPYFYLLPAFAAIFEACCTSEETTATEVNTCLATLPALTTTAATEPISTETTTTATEAGTTAATEAAPTPTSAPSSGNIASVSFPMMIGYTLFNYV